MKDTLILAIESSCDETAASVVKKRQNHSVKCDFFTDRSSYFIRRVVPEIASRKHIEKINQVIEQALSDAGVTLDDLDAIGVTYGPGLVGALLVELQRQRRLPMLRNFHWLGFIISKVTYQQIILNIRIWNRHFSV